MGNIEMVNAVLGDLTEDLGIQFDEISGAITQVNSNPVDWMKHLREVQNQGAQKKTAYYCTAYAQSMITDCLNLEAIPSRYKSGEEFGDIAVKDGILDPKQGAFLINMAKLGIKVGIISGFYQIKKTAEQLREALKKSPIYTGSNTINWLKTYSNNGVMVKNSGAASIGHCFMITTADDTREAFFSPNSYTKEKGFWIPYKDVSVLYNSTYGMSIDSIFKNLALLEKRLVEQKGKRVVKPLEFIHLSDVQDIDMNMLEYYKMKSMVDKGQITELEFKVFQIAYRRAYKLKTLADEIKI